MRYKLIVSVALPVLALTIFAFGVSTAAAAQPAPGWSVEMVANPNSFSAAGNAECARALTQASVGSACDAYRVKVRNAGSLVSNGSAVVLGAVVPAGLTVQKVSFFWSGLPAEDGGSGADLATFGLCTSSPVRCELPTEEFGLPPVAPDDTLEMVVYVTVTGAPGPLEASASVTGGGAPQASAVVQNAISETAPPFGFAYFGALSAGLDGLPDTQAGDHPYEFTTRIEFNNESRQLPENSGDSDTSIQDARDVVVDLPLGFLGSALAAPQCTLSQLASEAHCPADTTIGHLATQPEGKTQVISPIWNLVPEHGVAAELGYVDPTLHSSHVLYASVVPSPKGYVLQTTAYDIPQVPLTSIEAVLYGNPAERDQTGNNPVAFFTNPADCSGEPLVTSIHMDSWQNPGRTNADGSPDLSDPNWVGSTSEAPPVTGCDRLRFEPSLSVTPESVTQADSPAGLEVEAKVPQKEEPESLATPPLRNASVTLPEGLTIDPSAATGLTSCSEAQIALSSPDAPTCPESSKVGTVEVDSPAVATTLTGALYLAAQNENPFHTLLAGYIVVEDPTTGVVVKIPGNLTPDPATGQITGVFTESPQFPFSDLKLHFFGGDRGELATPQGCGTYTTTSDLMPWSAPDSGPDATPFSSFQIESGCNGGFHPGFTAGTENPQAGGYSPFTLSLSRNDGEQDLSGVSVTLPPGLLGKIAGIPLCPDANAGTCPESSLVGSVQAGAGSGPNPLFVGGKAYLTGPYNGGPYGLVVEVPAVAGPFNLGTVVVRQSLRIDPLTAQVTAVSDPFPTMLDGIPLRVRRVDVTLDRPGFTFNPTNCTPMSITGAVTSAQGASTNVSSRFQVGGCRELPFNPAFTVSTQAKTSKHNGASLTVKGKFPAGDANIHSVAVVLPKQLPARLTTIQQACPEATFAANPATCPVGSLIGTATASTPVLAGPVVGPTYLVSHGGAAFPNVTAVLQGGGVTVELVGSVNIKKSITSSDFAAVPDAPISTFQLSLPEGPHSGLAAVLPAKAKGDMCGTSLSMPFTITGQNGAQLKQNVKIAVTGCPAPKKKVRAKKRKTSKQKKG